jgi:threonine-phosphate decarboxylase
VILANPANPTGRQVPEESLGLLMAASKDPNNGFFLAIDEAFMDFCLRKNTKERQVSANPNLLVMKSLTKLFAIPGLRLGYLACGNRSVMEAFRKTSEPWSVNSLAQAAGMFLLGRKEYIKKTPVVTAGLREALIKSIGPYFDFVPTEANFVCGKLKNGRRDDLIYSLYSQGILVRNLDGMPGMPEGYLRLAVRPMGEIKRLEQALEDFYA